MASTRLITLGLLPLILLVTLQVFFPALLQGWLDLVGLPDFLSESAGSPFARHETPLIISAFPHLSHYEKIATVAVTLAELGYPITFITGRIFQKEASSLHPNITFHPLQGLDDKMSPEDYQKALAMSEEDRKIHFGKVALLDGMKDSHNTIQEAFGNFRSRYGDSRPILSFYDAPVVGHLPCMLGAPVIKPDKSFVVSMHPITLDSNDSYPMSVNKYPETGPNANALHWKAYQDRHLETYTRVIDEGLWENLRHLGADRESFPSFLDIIVSTPDYLMTLGVPEFEYPRSDLRSNIHYMGALRKRVAKNAPRPEGLPTWWEDLEQAKAAGKKIVAVSSGTLENDFRNLMIPTLEALKDRNDVLVIASTVVVEPEDVPGLVLPANARAAKFIPYDFLLPYVDVLVNNGGYGAVMTALNNGVSLVVAGAGEDKVLTNNIIQWTGVGLNLNTTRPGADQIREAVNKVLDDGTYKERGLAMSKNFDRYDLGSVFDKVIKEAVRDWAKEKSRS